MSAELTGPIVRKQPARRIATSAVLVPGESDTDGEVLSAEKIEEVAHDWLAAFRAFDVQHSVQRINATPVESYIEPSDRTVEVQGEQVTLPGGTWTVSVKVHDEAVWNDIVSGKRSGLSIMGVPEEQREAAVAAAKAGKLQEISPAIKRVTLADVGGGDSNGDWFVPFIGIVDEPAVPKAKFHALKAASPDVDKFDDMASLLRDDHTDKAGRRFSDRTYQRLQEAAEAVNALMTQADQEREDEEVTPDQVKEAVKAAMSDQLQSINDRLDKLEGNRDDGGQKPDEGDQPQSGDGSTDGGDGGQSTGQGENNSQAASDGDGSQTSGDASAGKSTQDSLVEALKQAVQGALKDLDDRTAAVERRTRPGSHQPTEPATKKEPSGPTRDAWGRRID